MVQLQYKKAASWLFSNKDAVFIKKKKWKLIIILKISARNKPYRKISTNCQAQIIKLVSG